MAKALIVPAFASEVLQNYHRQSVFSDYLSADLLKFPEPEFTFQDPEIKVDFSLLSRFAQENIFSENYRLLIGEVRSGFLWSLFLRLQGRNLPAIIFARVNPFALNDLLPVFLFSQVALPQDRIINGAKCSGDCYRQFGLTPFISHQGIDFSIFKPLENSQEMREQIGLKEDRTIFIYSGRMARDKKVLELIRFFNESGLNNYHLLIATVITESDYYSDCQQEAAKNSNIRFLFNLNSRQLAKVYNLSDFFISFSTSHYESFGRAPLEALACGKPVLVPDYNGFREYFPEGCGFLLPKKMNDFWEVEPNGAFLLIKKALSEKELLQKKAIDSARSAISFLDKKKLTSKNIRLARNLLNESVNTVNFSEKRVSLTNYPEIIQKIFQKLEGKYLTEIVQELFVNKKIIDYPDDLKNLYYKFIFAKF